MNLPRLWRTVRHLSAGQWCWRLSYGGKRVVMRALPGAARAYYARTAKRLPLPDPASPRLAACAAPVLTLQNTVHGDQPDDVAAGQFTLLNRAFDFGGVEAIPWRGDFHEGDNPLRRMTLAYMGYAVPLLARGRADDLQTVARLLRGLEAGNPWSAPGALRDVWNPYAASHRLINLLCGLALYRSADGPAGTDAEAEILDHARFCAAFVAANLERDLQYNHLLKNLVALATYACVWSSPPRPFALLPDVLARALSRNILADGGHAERSPMYHALAMVDVEVLAASGVLQGETADRLADIRTRTATALGVMTHPDDDIALFNDAWLGEAPPARDLADLSSTPDIARLPETGYVRLGRGGDAVIFDCGPCGPDDNPAHAHADFLSVEVSIAGARFIVDPGVPTYTAGADRDRSRSAAAHNGPHLEGAEPIEFWKSFRVGRRGRAAEITDATLAGIAPLWCAGRQDGYARPGVEVRRFVGLWPGEALLVADVWIGSARHGAATGFLIPADWLPDAENATAFTRDGARVRLSVPVGRLDGVAYGRYWPRFDFEMPAHRVSLRPEDRGGHRAAVAWFAWSGAAREPEPDTLAQLVDRLVEAHG